MPDDDDGDDDDNDDDDDCWCEWFILLRRNPSPRSHSLRVSGLFIRRRRTPRHPEIHAPLSSGTIMFKRAASSIARRSNYHFLLIISSKRAWKSRVVHIPSQTCIVTARTSQRWGSHAKRWRKEGEEDNDEEEDLSRASLVSSTKGRSSTISNQTSLARARSSSSALRPTSLEDLGIISD